LAGKRVVLVDADLRSPRVHAYFGTPNVLGVSQVVARRVELSKAVIPVVLDPSRTRGGSVLMSASVRAGGSNGKNAKLLRTITGQPEVAPDPAEWVWPDESGEAPILRLLTSGLVPPNPGEIVASRRFGDIINELSASADLVLIDAPAMLAVGDTAALAPRVEALAFVVNPEQIRRPMLQRAHEQLAKLPCRTLGFIVIGEAAVGGYYGYRSAGEDAPVAQPPKPLSSVSRRDS
jgi:Mrp family chromosome partitioning ATPase